MTGTRLFRVPNDEINNGRKRQYLHCAWQPGGGGDTVGLSDDQGAFQLLHFSTGTSSDFYKVGYSAVPFPASAPLRSEQQMWDDRPWSQFCFVPNDPGALIFIQWQSDTVCWSRTHTDGARPAEVVHLGQHSQRVRTIAVDAGGQYAAAGSDDGLLSLWDMDTLSQYHKIEGAHNGATTALCFHGKYVFSAGTDQRVKWWDVKSGELISEFVTHDSPVLDMASTIGPMGAAGNTQCLAASLASSTFPS